MERTRKEEVNIPSIKEIRLERRRLARQNRKRRIFLNTIYTLIIVAAVAVLLATLFFPVLQMSGISMEPTLEDRQIILLVKTNHLKTGDLCSFNWQNKLLIKRIIGGPGDVVNIDERHLQSHMWMIWHLVNVILLSHIRFRIIGTLYWEITEACQ